MARRRNALVNGFLVEHSDEPVRIRRKGPRHKTRRESDRCIG